MGPVLECVDMAAKETTLNELGETLAYVVEHMATKDDLAAVEAVLKEDIASVRTELKSDIAALGEQTASIERDLKQIRRDLYELADRVENIGGYRKEIDHALERIAAIERHLGIERKIVA
jgi:septal ring factor EnvC (AmiA/AmiB activator)